MDSTPLVVFASRNRGKPNRAIQSSYSGGGRYKPRNTKRSAVGFRALLADGHTECLELVRT
jgi:hypothetical protein